jgi:hypothetical protein
MFVAIVTFPTVLPCRSTCVRPASSTIAASRSWNFAFSTSCSTPYLRVSIALSRSDFSTLVVPTSTGRPASENVLISSMIAAHFSASRRYTRSSRSRRITGRLVGIVTTSSL